MIKLAVFDIDGTLIPLETHELAPETASAIQTLKKRGVKVVIATGRQYSSVQPELRALGFDYYIGGNGSCLTDGDGQILKAYYLSKGIVDELTKALVAIHRPLIYRYPQGGYDANPSASLAQYSQHFFNAKQQQQMKEEPPVVIGPDDLPFAAVIHVEEDEKAHLERQFPQLEFVSAGHGHLCDVTGKGVDKGRGLYDLCDLLGISPSDTVAFGDDANDVELVRAAGTGVAMGNAVEAVKQAANFQTGNCLDLGVVQALINLHLI